MNSFGDQLKDALPTGKDNNIIRPNYASGAPIKEMLKNESDRHSESKGLRLKDLQRNTR